MIVATMTFPQTQLQRCPGLPQKECQHHHQHADEFVPSPAPPAIYSRNMTSQMALASAQMGDSDLDSFPSSRITIGDEPAGQQTRWEGNLSSPPKDCYYCTRYGSPTGKCAQDSGEWGSGKNNVGENCPSCGGTGVCRHCHGDGIIG